MYHGYCDLVINQQVSGQVEYRYDNSGRGSLWIPDVLIHRTFDGAAAGLEY